jgi:hypothetical protein
MGSGKKSSASIDVDKWRKIHLAQRTDTHADSVKRR